MATAGLRIDADHFIVSPAKPLGLVTPEDAPVVVRTHGLCARSASRSDCPPVHLIVNDVMFPESLDSSRRSDYAFNARLDIRVHDTASVRISLRAHLCMQIPAS